MALPQPDDDDNLAIYDEIEIEDMTFDPLLQLYHYPCPCGDRFQIPLDHLCAQQDIAVCPSCSLMIRVIYHVHDLPKQPPPSGSSDSQIALAA
ncbi:hypothetical protein CDD82_2219 [Ophiocordyceps australis]|uniref:Diphthamide biosynthesis protein 3 n=1 Tax=Ophiocordyceps australis TaxID=1399860 RepID=A0A2C5XVJ9_9HYPO|nr:hypothetical protein CDD82_2219 [Ophiocordyceps australis]